MRNLFIFFLVLVFNILPLNGQSIKINNSYSPEVLVQDVFVNGACKNISKIRSIGNRAGIGFFEGGRPSIGLEKGIILSTGNVKNAEGPNQKRDITTDFGDVSSDVDLVKLATGPVFDVVGIEFDFVPLDSFVNFRYVFASDEYCEYVGQKFSEVFPFLGRRKTPNDFRILLKQYYGIVKRMEELDKDSNYIVYLNYADLILETRTIPECFAVICKGAKK